MKGTAHGAAALGLLLFVAFGAQAKDPFPVTPELIDSIAGPDATWPKDPAVPDLPPLPDTDDPPPPKDNYLDTHAWDGVHSPGAYRYPKPLTAPVSEANPLEVDVIWSMRSPYSYLALQRLVWLNSNYNVDLTVRVVLPIAVRSTKGGSGKAGGAFGIWYKLTDTLYDTYRSGEFHGVPFKWATPDPIWQNIHPIKGKDWEFVHPPEKQPYIQWVVRLCAYAQLKGNRGLDCVNEVSSIIWGNQVAHWPAHVKERFNRIEGLDYDEAIEFIRKNPGKVDAVWLENSKVQTQAGHGGVPLMIFQGEPFFGGDRFDQLFWRLSQSGLTERKKARPPFTTKPLRWPSE
jgi:2-hydroxychromene-2-carboxylate isomerase